MANVIIGIDPASTKLAAVALSGDKFAVLYDKNLGKSGGQSCSRAAKMIERFIVQTVPKELSWEPIYAFIESPIVGRGGVKTTMVQAYTSGAIQAVLYELRIPTQTANVSSWKKHVVGKGNATKDDVAAWLRLRRPALFAASSGVQDIIDAACIAIYGQQVLSERMG